MLNQVMSKLQQQALILMQALLGVISPNFRMIWITVDSSIVIHIVLEQYSDEDEEEIEDLKGEFEALQSENTDYEFKTYVLDEDIAWPDLSSTIVLYKRRES